MDRQMPIMDMLREYMQKDTVRFHMPGHKGDTGFFGGDFLKGDITEISNADNLSQPKGVIRRSQALNAKRTGAEYSFYSVNGSSAGVMSMILAALKEGGKIIMARDIHLSAVNALILTGVMPVFLDVETDTVTGLPGAVSKTEVKKTLSQNPDAKAVFLTYPNYFGMCADLSGICAIAHEMNIPVIVDAAHSANFSYSPLLPDCCSKTGADVWVVSAHKTLPAMNQCAYVNVSANSLINAHDIKNFLNVFTTTSPSYILLASVEYAGAYMEEAGSHELYKAVSITENYMEKIDTVRGLKCIGMDILGRANIYDKDILKLVIDVSGRNITGMVAKKALEDAGIYIEAADLKHILMLVTVADTIETFEALYPALQNLPEGIRYEYIFSPYQLPEVEFLISPKEASWCKTCMMPPDYAVGFAAARPVTVYPPGVPCLLPGQLITREVSEYILSAAEYGFDILGIEDGCICAADI